MGWSSSRSARSRSNSAAAGQSVNLGSLVAEQVVQIVLRLNFPLGEIGRETGAVVSLSARDSVADGESVALDWEYADGKTNDLQERNAEVDRAVARVFAARARQEATALNRVGNFPGAQAALHGVAKRIRTYAGRDTEMRALVSRARGRRSEHVRGHARRGAQGDAFPELRLGQDAQPGWHRPPPAREVSHR